MRKIVTVLLAAFIIATMSGCMTLNHSVGDGGNGVEMARQKQWYLLWGLIPLNKVDGGKIAADHGLGAGDNFTIKSTRNAGDIILNLFTGILTIQSQTVSIQTK